MRRTRNWLPTTNPAQLLGSIAGSGKQALKTQGTEKWIIASGEGQPFMDGGLRLMICFNFASQSFINKKGLP
jgi:hypothetical protein